MVKLYRIVLVSILFLFCIGGVCATDPDTNNTDLDNNCLVDVNCSDNNIYTLNHDKGLYTSDNVTALTNNNVVTNDSSDLSDVPCAVSSYISVTESYTKSVNVETAIKDTNTVNNVTSVDGLVSALTNQGLKRNVIKTNSIENLKELHKDKRNNIIVHMIINHDYHFGHIKKIKKDGILLNNNFFMSFEHFKDCYNNIFIIITNNSQLNLNSFGKSINKSEWTNITGKLSEKDLFNYNYGLINKSISLNKKYSILKANINGSEKRSVESIESVLFGDTLNPKMINLVKIQGQLTPIYNNPNAPQKLLNDLNNILNPMQKNLNKTISDLDYLIKMINKHSNKNNIKSSHNSSAITLKHVDVSKLLGECGEAITENPLLNQFVDNFKESVNNLNILNANPELREYYDDKYGLDHHKIGFIDYYTIKK